MLLSEGEKLDGVAEVRIKYDPNKGFDAMSLLPGYYNPETGEWETVPYMIDEDNNEAVILTDHFPKFGLFEVEKSGTPTAFAKPLSAAQLANMPSNTATKILGKIGTQFTIIGIVAACINVASTAEIDISDMKTYGADTFRVYKADKSYVDVKAANGKITNPTGAGEVTVVPIYRFNYTNAAMEGYTTATGTFTAETGYGLIDGQSYSTNENGSLPKDAATLHVVLPAGSYDMNILRKGGARSDVYNDGVQIINNTTSSGSQNRGSSSGLMYAPQVLVADGSADITIGNTSGTSERIATVEIVKVPDKCKKPIIWIAGDSESANYYPIDADGDDLDSSKIMMTGFGMQFPKFLSDKYKVANWGQPSATVKTWYDECFDAVNYRMAEGDTIIVEFGINDSISSSNKMSIDEMKEQMTAIFTAAKAKNVKPILVSPLWNSKYQHKTYFTYDKTNDTNAMYAFAQSAGVDCIDLNKWS